MVGRIKLGQPQAGQRHGQLKDEDPAPPPSQQPGLEAIEQRCPDELEGIGQPHQREVADGVQVNAIDREPRLKCPRRERQRQPAGKAQQQHRGNAPRREDLPIGLPQPGRGLGGIAHPPSVAARGLQLHGRHSPPVHAADGRAATGHGRTQDAGNMRQPIPRRSQNGWARGSSWKSLVKSPQPSRNLFHKARRNARDQSRHCTPATTGSARTAAQDTGMEHAATP